MEIIEVNLSAKNKTAALPSSVCLRSMMPPIHDQGGINSSTSQAVSAMLNMAPIKGNQEFLSNTATVLKKGQRVKILKNCSWKGKIGTITVTTPSMIAVCRKISNMRVTYWFHPDKLEHRISQKKL